VGGGVTCLRNLNLTSGASHFTSLFTLVTRSMLSAVCCLLSSRHVEATTPLTNPQQRTRTLAKRWEYCEERVKMSSRRVAPRRSKRATHTSRHDRRRDPKQTIAPTKEDQIHQKRAHSYSRSGLPQLSKTCKRTLRHDLDLFPKQPNCRNYLQPQIRIIPCRRFQNLHPRSLWPRPHTVQPATNLPQA